MSSYVVKNDSNQAEIRVLQTESILKGFVETFLGVILAWMTYYFS